MEEACLHKIGQSGGRHTYTKQDKVEGDIYVSSTQNHTESMEKHTLVHTEQYEVKGGDLDETVENI